MIAAISRFRIRNGTEQEVEAAFRARPGLVDTAPGFLGMETFTESEDPTVFHLFTRWTDIDSFRAWHGSASHKESHQGIPKGIKLDAAYTRVLILERLHEETPRARWREKVVDAGPFLAEYLSDSTEIYCIFCGPDGILHGANATAAALWAKSAEESQGLSIWDRLPARDAENLRGWIERGRSEEGVVLVNFLDHLGHPLTVECAIEVRPDGFTLIGEQSRRDEGLLRENLIQLNNELAVITREKERTARELRRTNEAQRIAGVGSWQWDIATNQATWSDEFFRLVGYEPRSFEPDFERYIATVHPDDREMVRAKLRRALEDRQPFSYEFRVVHPDGTERKLYSRGDVFTDPAGRAVRIAGTSQDITERKALEERLAAHRAQLDEAQRIAQMGNWSYDPSTDRMTWSDELTRIFGLGSDNPALSLQESMGAVHPDDRDRVRKLMSRAMEDHQPISYEVRIVRPDGVVRVGHARVNVFTDDAGAVVRMAGIFQDITERKAIEDEVVRTTAAKVAAEEASLVKGKFLATMSHELRTPLNSVIGFANVLLKNKSGKLEATDLQYLERIQANGKHLLELINAVLDLSKIEVGKMEVEVKPVSLRELVGETLDELRGAVRDETVELRAVLPDSMTPLATDRGKLKQILINLVGNAIKFTEKGEVTVEVYADAETHRPKRIEVRDTGPGIPRDRLDAIFVAFEQAEAGTARRFGGTGLGLSIVASLSELLGFGIEVESEPGVGSTFRLLLPTDRAEPTGMEAATWPNKVADCLAPGRPIVGEKKLDGRLVLVIDDDTDSRILLTHDLEESGARTITASTGEQGLRMAREFHPDIITLDLLLPGMKGWEILRALKSDPELETIPVVIVSVVACEGHGSAVGAADVIEKPINRDELIAALRRTLTEQPRRILIVDDMPDDRDLLSSYLEDEGAEIRTARDGSEALRIIEEFTPDLVLLDLIMPDMDGIAVIRKLSEREPYRNIPIIIVTAKDLTAEEEERLSQSTLAVLRKGARLEPELREAIQGIL